MSGLMSKIITSEQASAACMLRYLLEQQGYRVDLFERSDKIGGRMSSVRKSGFIFDRVFHVMQTGYPIASEIIDYEAMGCKAAFEPGALIIASTPTKNAKYGDLAIHSDAQSKVFLSLLIYSLHPLICLESG